MTSLEIQTITVEQFLDVEAQREDSVLRETRAYNEEHILRSKHCLLRILNPSIFCPDIDHSVGRARPSRSAYNEDHPIGITFHRYLLRIHRLIRVLQFWVDFTFQTCGVDSDNQQIIMSSMVIIKNIMDQIPQLFESPNRQQFIYGNLGLMNVLNTNLEKIFLHLCLYYHNVKPYVDSRVITLFNKIGYLLFIYNFGLEYQDHFYFAVPKLITEERAYSFIVDDPDMEELYRDDLQVKLTTTTSFIHTFLDTCIVHSMDMYQIQKHFTYGFMVSFHNSKIERRFEYPKCFRMVYSCGKLSTHSLRRLDILNKYRHTQSIPNYEL